MENAYVGIVDAMLRQHPSQIHLNYQQIINKISLVLMELNIILFILIEDNLV